VIWRLAELNRVLFAVREVMDEEKRADLGGVVRQCASMVIDGTMPDHDESIACAARVGFLSREETAVSITSDGEEFLNLNAERLYDLSADQKRVLLRTAFLNGVFRSETRAVLKKFAPAYGNETYRWSAFDSSPLEAEGSLIENLQELGLLNPWGGPGRGFEVAREYVDPVATFLSERDGLSEERLEEFLRERKEIGALAERLVLDVEIARLRGLRCDVEAMCVRHISKLTVDAGYDIQSFDGATPSMHYDRFIEAKGSRGADLRFFWSENEMKVAEELGPRYWIYFQGGIDKNSGTARNRVLLFQNPLETILKHTAVTTTRHGLLVEGRRLRGAQLVGGIAR
jgi:hypothetical protein